MTELRLASSLTEKGKDFERLILMITGEKNMKNGSRKTHFKNIKTIRK